jgi:PPM family protein phosphatase
MRTFAGKTPAAREGSEMRSLPAVRVDVHGVTRVGRERPRNEDAFLVSDLSRDRTALAADGRGHALGPAGTLLVVCDGVGGGPAGDVASRLAADALHARMRDEGPSPFGRDEVLARFVAALRHTARRVYDVGMADRARRGMGTTTTAALVRLGTVFVVHVGDSRAYLLREGVVVQLTRDQSLVHEMAEKTGLSEEELAPFVTRNVLSQALGAAPEVDVDACRTDLRSGDALLLCTDGLWSVVAPEEVRERLASAEDARSACDALSAAAQDAGAPDDVAIVVARFEGDALPPPLPGEPVVVDRPARRRRRNRDG